MSKRDAGLYGWQMVPIHSTSEMKTEITYSTGYDYHLAQGLWARLLDYAPLPPQQSDEFALLQAKADAMSEVSAECRSVAASYNREGFSDKAAAVELIARHTANREKDLRTQAYGGVA